MLVIRRLVNDVSRVLLARTRRRIRQLQATVRHLEQELADLEHR